MSGQTTFGRKSTLTRTLHAWLSAFGAAAALTAGTSTAIAQSEAVEKAAAPVNEKYGVDIRKMFATSCSLCHGEFGLKQGGRGGGPKLAGTAKTKEQVMDRIANGKEGMMPAFKAVLKENQIEALAEYIKALPAK
jgi:mono/diheme cytochrome c family protein